MNEMIVDRKAFDAAWEAIGWDNQNPHATEAQERFVAAYEQARLDALPKERVERVAAAIDPAAFVGTDDEIHRHCRSMRVDVYQEKVREKARAAILADDDWRRAQVTEGTVERVAKAIREAQAPDGNGEVPGWRYFVLDAKAAIAALGPEPVEVSKEEATTIIRPAFYSDNGFVDDRDTALAHAKARNAVQALRAAGLRIVKGGA